MTLDECKAEERVALDRLIFARTKLVQLIHDTDYPIDEIVWAMARASIRYTSAYLAWSRAFQALDAAHMRERELAREAAPRKEKA